MSRVLIADDDTKVALAYTNFLTKEKNIEVIGIANNGIEAINLYNEKKPDVLILDLDMPQMNGLGVIDELAKDTREKKKNNIIVISGALEKLRPYKTSQIYMVMQKPFDHNSLIKIITEIQNNIDDENLESEIDNLLLEMKLYDSRLKGLDYLKKAVFYCYKDIEYRTNIGLAYDAISKDYFLKKVKPKNILWSLESLIDVYSKRVSKEFLSSIFIDYEYYMNLTPKYLVDLMVSHLERTI